MEINWKNGHCVIVNLKCGTMRQIPGDSLVKVYDGELILTKCLNVGSYLKQNSDYCEE